jgi:hypothetical protein
MNFNYRNHRDDLLFVIALLVPAVFSGACYIDSQRQIVRIEQAQSQAASVAANGEKRAHERVAYAPNPGR